MEECGFQQDISTNNIRINEFRRTINRAVDMAFRRQMHNGIGLKASKNVADTLAITDIGSTETKSRVALQRSERC
jgi:hypothetical protein